MGEKYIRKKGIKRKIQITVICMVIIAVIPIYYYNDKMRTENKEVKAVDNYNNEQEVETKNIVVSAQYCNDAITNLNKEQYEEVLEDMYENVDEENIEQIEEMEVSEMKEEVDSFDEKYKLGDILSEEDAALLLYVREQVKEEREQKHQSGIVPIAWTTRKYNIGWSKKKYGVETKYKGSFKVWSGLAHGEYDTDVKITLVSGKPNSMQWITYHNAYGLIGTSGKTPSIGVTYSSKVKSSKKKSSFGFNDNTKYTALLDAYTSTWGKLKVVTKKGDYSITTKTYSSFE